MRRKHFKMLKSALALMLGVSVAVGAVDWSGFTVQAANRSEPWILSANRPAYSSSVNGGDIASFATDGKLGTQWGAAANLADQWLDVDLGGKADISKVVIDWQNDASYGVAYQVLVSNDEVNWETIYETTTGTGGTIKNVMRPDGSGVDYSYYEDVLSTDSEENYKLSEANGRYVRVLVNYSKSQSGSDDKTSGWGASIRELQIYGIGDEDCNAPASEAENIALGKSVEVSSYSQPWWAPAPLSGTNAVDDDYETYWLSETGTTVAETANQYFIVDLGETYTIGRAVIQWQVEFARIYDLQVSADGQNWTTVYRQLNGNGEEEEIALYAENVRYVRMQGIAYGRGSGYSIREMKVYEYEEGDEKVTYSIPALPQKEVVQLGKGSYVIDDTNLLQPRAPKYVTNSITGAIPSNDWWTSIVYTQYSDTMPALPLVYSYSSTGLGLYYADGTYTRTDNGGMGADSKYKDITIGATNITGETSAKLDGYGDWSVNVAFSDNDEPKMLNTLIKGSPYVYSTFTDPSAVELNVNNPVKFFDKDGNVILTQDGEQVVVDHFGVETKNISEAPGDGNKDQYHYYGVYLPDNSMITKVGSKLKIKLGSNENYMVVGTLCVEEPIALLASAEEAAMVADPASAKDADAVAQLAYMYQYAYSYVTDSVVSYEFNETSSVCTTTYSMTVSPKKSGEGFKDSTLMCMMPHQWKYSDASYAQENGEALNYTSIRGDLRIHEGNTFSYSQDFRGIIPQYTTPEESDSYNEEWMRTYLNQFTESTLKSYWVADPYWQGKKSHPIAMGILIADQLGEYEMRDRLIDVLKKIMENWLTYDGEEDFPYYMYYHTSWGAVSGDGGDHGMAINLSDHHFLWAYFIFPSAVLASYDESFIEDYGPMVELLIRDAMNPNKEDDMLPFMRNFDPYEGHSWAGGYGDNNSGNNQESASEATFAWAGLYLWGLVTGNDTYRDVGIWGFTSEVNAIEQYWFNMDAGTELDSHNWAEGYGEDVYGDPDCDVLPYIGMVWGLGYTNGTYFSGNPCCIMGIHLLPVTPAITYMGYDRQKADEIWEQYTQIQEAYQAKLASNGESDPEGWYHILWPFMALSDAEGAAAVWANEYASNLNENDVYTGGQLPTDEMFNSYWYIQNMCAKGYPDTSVWSTNYTSYQVFSKTVNGETVYTAEVWNPTDEEITVHFANADGDLGSVKVPAHALVSSDVTKEEDKTGDVVIPPYEEENVANTIPGVVEAENYYTNLGCEPTENDVEGGYIGWIDDGDMLLYNVDVAEEGDYVLDYRVQCVDKNKNSAIMLTTDNDSDYISTTYLDNSVEGWKNVKAEDTIHLKAGQYQMKLKMVDGGFNFNYVKIYKEGTKPPIAETDDLTKADLSGYQELDLTEASVIDVSSVANDAGIGAHIIDGDYNTRWESESSDLQYLTIDLGKNADINGIKIYWEAAAAKKYEIQTSTDNSNWTTVFTQAHGIGGREHGDENRNSGLESIEFDNVTNARYIRIYCTERLTGYGVSIYEVKLFGSFNPGTEPDNPGEGGENPDPDNPGEGGEDPDPDNPGGEGNDPDDGGESTEDLGDVLPQDVPEGGAEAIPEGLWVAGIEEEGYDFTGQAIKPVVRVYDHKTRLVEKKDYTISYKNNKKAFPYVEGEEGYKAKKVPTVVIKGKGNYSGKETVTFKIMPLDINGIDFDMDNMAVVYKANKTRKVVPTLLWKGKKLVHKTDYSVTYPDAEKEGAYRDAGTYTIQVEGIRNFTGVRTITLEITGVNPISKVTVKGLKAQYYTGEEIAPDFTVVHGKKELTRDVDYTVTFENNKEVGTAYAVLTGIGNYSGQKRVSFKIKGTNMKNAKVIAGLPKEVIYNGKAQELKCTLQITVDGQNRDLVEDTDYTVSYEKNTNAGTATVTFTGKGGFVGKLKKTYVITKFKLAEDTENLFAVEEGIKAAYEKGGSKPKPVVTFDGATLTEGVDYTLSYQNNKILNDGSNPDGIPKIIVKGKGNFAGSKSVSFTIASKGMENLQMIVADKVESNKKNGWKSAVKVVDRNAKILKAGVDYDKTRIEYTYKEETPLANGEIKLPGATVNPTDKVPAGTVIQVKVYGIGNYTGELAGEYRILTKGTNIKNAKIKIEPQIYTGKEITLAQKDIKVTLGGVELQYGSEYEIVEGSYKNNVKKGKASVTIRGIEDGTGKEYGGTKTITFTIRAKEMKWWEALAQALFG